MGRGKISSDVGGFRAPQCSMPRGHLCDQAFDGLVSMLCPKGVWAQRDDASGHDDVLPECQIRVGGAILSAQRLFVKGENGIHRRIDMPTRPITTVDDTGRQQSGLCVELRRIPRSAGRRGVPCSGAIQSPDQTGRRAWIRGTQT